MSVNKSNKLITNGLIDCFDVGNSNSYIDVDQKVNSLSRNYKPQNTIGTSGPMSISVPSSGFANLRNGTAFSEENKGVLNFDGMNDYVQLNTSVTLSHLTYSIWYNPSLVDTSFRTLGQTGAWSTTEFACFFKGNGHKLSLRTKSSNGVTDTSLPGVVNPNFYNTWHNATFVVEPSKQSIYYNGQFCKSTTRTNDSDINMTKLQIGSWMGYGFFGGKMGTTTLYNRALSDSEIKHNYNALKSRFIS
jgi:hypothetical protein